jgi:hypothetical protein
VGWFWPFNTDRGEQGELYELDLSPPPMRQPDETHIAYRARLAEPDPRMTMLLQLRDARLRDIEPRRPKPSTEGIILPSIDQVMGKNIGRRVARIAKLRSALAARDDAVGVAPPQSGSVRAGDIDKLIAAGARDPEFLRNDGHLTALGQWNRTRPAVTLRGAAGPALTSRSHLVLCDRQAR